MLVASVASAAPPDDARARALELHRAGDTAGAVTLLEAHLANAPQDLASARLLAEFVVATAKPAKAAMRLELLTMRYPEQPDLLVMTSRSWEAAGNLDKATAAMAAAVAARESRREPVDAAMFSDLARLYALVGNPREEAATLDRYVAIVPGDRAALLRLLALREHLGHHDDAQRVLLLLTDHGKATDDAALLVRLAESYLRTGQPFTAIKYYRQAHEVAPGDVTIMRKLASLYGWYDQPNNQLDFLRRVAIVSRDEADDQVVYAEALYEREKFEHAARVMRRASQLRPKDVHLKLRLATMLEAAGEDNEALGVLEEVREKAPGNLEVHERLARAHRDRGENFLALQHYRHLHEADPTDPTVNEAIEDLEVLVRPRIGVGYDFTNDRNGHVGHMARVWFENQPSDFWRYFIGYKYTNHSGRSLVQNGVDHELQSHGGWFGVKLRLARYTTLDAEISINGYVDSFTFVGTRVGLVQKARFPLEFRLWFERREDDSTIDALEARTVVYDLHAQLDIEPVDRWLVEFGGSYGRWIHSDFLTGERQRNNGFGWYAGTGVRAVEEPLTLEFMLDYTGQAFELSADAPGSRIPYFAPELYQTAGLRVFLEHQPHWRFLYRLYTRPHWIFEDEAFQLDYGAAVEIKFHKRHWLELTFERTDTLVGTTDKVFRENIVRAVYIGVF